MAAAVALQKMFLQSVDGFSMYEQKKLNQGLVFPAAPGFHTGNLIPCDFIDSPFCCLY